MLSTLERIAVMTMDGGVTTGLSWGVYDLELNSKKDYNSFQIVREGLRDTSEVISDEGEQRAAAIIATRWLDLQFRWTVEAQIAQNRQFFVMEDFILQPKGHNSTRSTLAPVRMNAYVQGMLYQYEGIQYEFQMPSLAKGKATDSRLKAHDLWQRGSAHTRDAVRHAVTFVSRCLS